MSISIRNHAGPTPYHFHEGTIDLPQGFADRTANIFISAEPGQSQLNLNIARDAMEPGETLATYVDRQIALLEKNLRGYRLRHRQAERLGSGQAALAGERIDATRKEGGQILHQRQAAFVCGAQRVLVLSGTGIQPFADAQDAMWAAWLASFRPAARA